MITDIRKEYTLLGLRRRDLHPDAISQFQIWFQQAADADVAEPSAMTLATADKDGRPSARMVLLKSVDERGFSFYTNHESRKGRELAENPRAALVFYWAELERQVCVSGDVSKLPIEESLAYFRTRPRENRLSAWASRQSQVIPNRDSLEARFHECMMRYPGENIPLPPYWGGCLLAPHWIEFWQGRPHRLHDRFRYTRLPVDGWLIERLAP